MRVAIELAEEAARLCLFRLIPRARCRYSCGCSSYYSIRDCPGTASISRDDEAVTLWNAFRNERYDRNTLELATGFLQMRLSHHAISRAARMLACALLVTSFAFVQLGYRSW
jgi:hypothetical protein